MNQPIPLIDVKAQYAPLVPELQERFASVLESGRFIFGPEVEGFEHEAAAFLGVPHAIGVANGTDALILALEALGIGRGDEVISPFHLLRDGGGDRAGRRDARLRRHRACDAEPRPGGRRTAHHDEDQGDRSRPSLRAARRSRRARRARASAHRGRSPGVRCPGHRPDRICSTFSFFPTKNLFALGDGGS